MTSAGVDDLKAKSMTARSKKRYQTGLNRSISDTGWSQFRAILMWQATKAGNKVIVLRAKDATQRCSSCGTKAKPRIELSDRVFGCKACALVIGRDRNSARNLTPIRTGVRLGRSEPDSAAVPVSADGDKTRVSAETSAT